MPGDFQYDYQANWVEFPKNNARGTLLAPVCRLSFFLALRFTGYHHFRYHQLRKNLQQLWPKHKSTKGAQKNQEVRPPPPPPGGGGGVLGF
jgi:hypothetical protein